MTVAQIRALAMLVFDAELPPEKKIQFTKYVDDSFRVRFMNMNGDVLNYRIEKDGTCNYEPMGV